ncbi:MAG TPA: hypothetical protein VFO01_10190 [Trebonia sp.]|nr:hypothetical protein [Trebonia sp.]
MPEVDSSVLADRDCLVAFAAVVLCADRGVQAHKMGYDSGGIAYLTAKGAAGQTGLSKAAAGRALRRLEEAGLVISDGDGDAWRTSAGVFAGGRRRIIRLGAGRRTGDGGQRDRDSGGPEAPAAGCRPDEPDRQD